MFVSQSPNFIQQIQHIICSGRLVGKELPICYSDKNDIIINPDKPPSALSPTFIKRALPDRRYIYVYQDEMDFKMVILYKELNAKI